MIFICDSANHVTPFFSGSLRQGEINANEILFLAPYPLAGTTVSLRVLLPNGIVLPADPSKAFVFAEIDDPNMPPLNLGGVGLNAWRLRVDAAITEFAGNISFQFAIARIGAPGVPPSLFTTTTVVENIPRGVPALPSPDVEYEPSLIDLYTAAVDALDELENVKEACVPLMPELDRMMFEKFGGTYNGVTYTNDDYFFSAANWAVLLKCNRAYVQAYDSDDEFRIGVDGKGLYVLKALIRYGGILVENPESPGTNIDTQIPRYPWMNKAEWVRRWREANPALSEAYTDTEIINDHPPSWNEYDYMASVCERRPDGHIRIPKGFGNVTGDNSQLATSKFYVDQAVQGAKTYVDTNFITRTQANQNYATKISPPRGQSYVYIINGSGNANYVQITTTYAIASTIPQRNTSGGIVVKTANGNEGEAVSLPYANSHFLTPTQANNSYAKKVSGANENNRYVYTVYGDTAKAILLTKTPNEAATDTVPFRDTNGKLRVGTPTYDGSDDNNCAVPLSMLKDKLAALKAEILAEIGGS